MKASKVRERRGWFWSWGVGVGWLLSYFLVRLLLEQGGGVWLRVVAALLPLALFVLLLLAITRGIRGMDELQRRIHLEALGVAYPLAMLLLMTLGLLEQAIDLPPDDLSYRHVWALLPLFYLFGLVIARRRYE